MNLEFLLADRPKVVVCVSVCILQDQALWACLAGMAMANRELNTAETAYASIREVSIHYKCAPF